MKIIEQYLYITTFVFTMTLVIGIPFAAAIKIIMWLMF